jgi:hypothetical protein
MTLPARKKTYGHEQRLRQVGGGQPSQRDGGL